MDSEDKTSADVREGNPLAPSKSEEPKPSVESGVKSAEGEAKASERSDAKKKATKEKCPKKHSKGKSRKTKTTTSPPGSSSDSDSDDGADGTSSSSSSDDNQSEAERSRKKRLAKKHQAPQKAKQKSRDKKHKKASKPHDSSSDSDSDSDSGSGSDSSHSKGSGSSDDEETRRFQTELAKQLQLFILQQQQQQQHQAGGVPYGYPPGLRTNLPPPIQNNSLRHSPPRPRRVGGRPPGRASLALGGVDPNLLLDGKQPRDKKKRQKATKLDYKRVDQVWDDAIHNYKLQDTAERTVDAKYEEFIFHVRRTFDWEGKYKTTIVDIKSKLLRACLQDVIGDIKGISLVDDTPKVDPNMLFLLVPSPTPPTSAACSDSPP